MAIWNNKKKFVMCNENLNLMIPPPSLTYAYKIWSPLQSIQSSFLSFSGAGDIDNFSLNRAFFLSKATPCTDDVVGPDDLPYWIWKEFGVGFAQTITEILNKSLKNAKVQKFGNELTWFQCLINLR